MKRYLVAAGALALLVPSVASAQEVAGEQRYFERTLPAPSDAFELSVGTGYTQGFGKLQSGVGVPDVAGAGIGVDLGIGYRMSPELALMAAGQYQELSAQNGLGGTRGFAGTLAAQLHLAPRSRLDPFLELGSGYRLLWIENGTTGPSLLDHGFQVARARAGFDVRLSEDVAIAPVIGADATVFVWQDAGAGSRAISSPALSTFVFAGLQGRFDFGGQKMGSTTLTFAEPELDSNE